MNDSLLNEIQGCINQLDNAELNNIVHMVNDRRDVLTSQARGNLWVDKPVSFDNDGYKFYGRVTKVNRKNTKVDAIREDRIDNGYSVPNIWSVPNGMLSHAPTFNVDQMKHTSVPVG
jgi:hypothetical protein